MLKIYIFCFLIANTFFLFAQEEQKFLEHIDHAKSKERILSLTIYYEKNIHKSPAQTPQRLDAMLTQCYFIAKRDNDIQFKNYLDFYKKTNAITFLSEEDLLVKEEKILRIWQEILKQYESSENEHFTAICHVNIGFSLFMLNKYSESLEELLIADEKFRKVGYENFPEMGKHLHNMAMVFYFFRQYEKVAKLMEISVKLPRYDRNRDIQRYYTLGCAYNFLKKYQKAEEAFLKTKQTASLYMDPLWATIASRGMAKVYLNQGKYNEALYLYKNTLNSVKDVNNVTNNLYSREYSEHLLDMAKTYILLNDNPKARQCLDNINYRTSSKTKDQMFMFGVTYQDINYWLNFYDVQCRYSFASKDYEKAYRYSDSLYSIKYKVDSLFNGLEVRAAQNRIDTKEKQYENDKKEATIQNKNKQMILIVSLLGVIIIASILLFLQNRKIKNRNKIINQQLKELSKTLDQKQVLLSELQHRVKNNLQHVISILEIQKESVDFNNIDELIRGNQNRIHSMALLHKKLNVSENVNDVDLKRYITELSELVKDSYDNHKKKIQLIIQCKIEEISIEKALPIGLIIVELVSNSMKHAFRNQNTGIIYVEIKKDEKTQKKEVYYSDNGSGFDFNKTNEKGLGIEIIKGLIDQLDGKTQTKNDNGFELMIIF